MKSFWDELKATLFAPISNSIGAAAADEGQHVEACHGDAPETTRSSEFIQRPEGLTTQLPAAGTPPAQQHRAVFTPAVFVRPRNDWEVSH